jgi:thymidylate synthase
MASEKTYSDLLRKIIVNGHTRDDRTGTGTISLFAEQLRFDISESVPLLTGKFVPWKAVIHELLWFLRGDTNAKHLQEKGVRIWDGNTSREFLDARGMTHYPEGDIGPGYGFQWRHASAPYTTCDADYTGKGIDQIQYVLDELSNNPMSRRIFMTSWNPMQIGEMALPPCHVSAQFYVEEDDQGRKLLSCHMYQRSVDCFLGLPFNIMSYTTLVYILAAKCGMHPKELVISTGDTHIYTDHKDQVCEYLTREPYESPKLVLDSSVAIKSFEEMTIEDFQVLDYKYHPSIKAKMSV